MLNCIYSVEARKYGVADIGNDGYFKPIVPLIYSSITFQKYGIVAGNFDGTCNSYLFDGTPIFSNAKNPLFLSDNLLIISSANGQCFIIDYIKNKPVINKGFDSILFFMGSNPQAIPYTSRSNFSNHFKTLDYTNNGAHLEELVGVRVGNSWGVINRRTGTIYADFNYAIMVQCVGARIAAKGFDGNAVQL